MKALFLLLMCVPMIGFTQAQSVQRLRRIKPPRGVSVKTDKITQVSRYRLALPAIGSVNQSIQPEILHSTKETYFRVRFVHHSMLELGASKIVVTIGSRSETFIPETYYVTTPSLFTPTINALSLLVGSALDGGGNSVVEVYTLTLKGAEAERFITLFSNVDKKDRLAMRFENNSEAVDYPEPDFHRKSVMAKTLKDTIKMVKFFQVLNNR